MTDKKGWLGPYPPNSRHADKVTIDEIVKLRAENEQLREALRLMPKTIVDAADEIERLRKENDRQRYDIMLLNSRLQTEHEIIRIAAMKEGE